MVPKNEDRTLFKQLSFELLDWGFKNMETWTHFEMIFKAMLTAMHELYSIYLLVIYIKKSEFCA